MVKNPILSVVVPAFNAAETLNRCVNSVLNQSHSDFQLIMVNDGSTDDTLRIIEKFAKDDRRISVLNLISNVGIHEVRKIGVENSVGDYIAFVDADDWILPGMYEHMLWEVLGEMGFVGLFLFLALGFAALGTAQRMIRLSRDRPELKWAEDLGRMIQVSLIGYATAGAFLNLGFFDLYYTVLVIIVAAWQEVARVLAKTSPNAVRAATSSVPRIPGGAATGRPTV